MNIELKPIAQKKLDQMAATVHGVLVKNEAGAWAAVSDAGRVMWLDGFEGRADETRATVMPSEHGKNRYGLDMAYFRGLFNRELSRPLVDFRPDELARVLARAARAADAAVLQEPEFQAARAQSGQGTEPVAFVGPTGYGTFFGETCEDVEKAAQNAGVTLNGTIPLYTHPQPAQQGSVLESRLVGLAKSLARDVIHLEDCEDREDRWTVEDRARSIAADIQELLSATPQTQQGRIG